MSVVVGVGAATVGWAGPAVAAPDPIDPAAVAAFLDREVPTVLDELRVPGLAVAVVAGGRPVLTAGYGVADVATGRRVDPATTTFPTDSVSKLFTGTAVMQLVERGALALDRDVNEYLTEFRLADTFPGRPVTLGHLLTHTAGFEERNVGILRGGDAPLGTYLAAHQPARLWPPGTVPAYSNYGVALAGHIVEVASGMRFEQYVAEHVFGPLGMTTTTFDITPTGPQLQALTRLYRPEGDDGMVDLPPSFGAMGPAGNAVTTAADMSRFMLAHLGGGALADGARILQPATTADMQARHHALDPRLPGMSYTFINESHGGRRATGHGGDGLASHSLLTLYPESGVGIYLVANGDGTGIGAGGGLIELTRRFAEHFVPAPAAAAPPAAVPAATERFAGDYRYTRMSGSDASRFPAAALNPVQVEAGADGTIVTTGSIGTSPNAPDVQRWLPVGENLFRADGMDELLAFQVDRDGRVTAMGVGDDPTIAWERVAWWQSFGVHIAVAAGCLAVLLTTFGWPVAAAVRRIRTGTWRHPDGRFAHLVAMVAVVAVGLLLAMGAYLLGDIDRALDAILGATWELGALHIAAGIAAIMTAAVLVGAVLAWRRGWWSRPARLHFTLVAAALTTFVVLLREYNLLAWPWA
ncbi:serine hydrolase domain-containing protein [Pseudonocardia sp. TRM90224]|uniref:serine hydrolase domain-containing protein n=1 Tax=Pseudonocardia sp. TRM90224 TaxID=2812678 RepID=UPI001E5519AE|nr:serine hydrolase domain-containing protein [Pseudonocardia sp. TRM90224]